MLLMQRIAFKEDDNSENCAGERNDTTVNAEAPSLIGRYAPRIRPLGASNSQISGNLSYINTEDPTTVQGLAEPEPTCSSYRLNEEPVLRTENSKPATLSARLSNNGRLSHRSAADLVKKAYDQFRTYQHNSNGSMQAPKLEVNGNPVFGAYVLTTDEKTH